MSCNDTTFEYGPIPVWTRRSDSDWVFSPISEPLNSTDIKRVRASWALDASTGNIEVRPAMRISNDGRTWDAPVPIGSPTPRSQDGTTWATGFDNIATTTESKALVQWGIQAKNTSGTSTQDHGMASLKIDKNGA